MRSTALEAEEAEANQQLQLAKKTGDAQQIEYLTRRWLKLTTQLREFDRAVEQFRRDSGQLVELKKAVQVMDWIGLWLIMGIQRLLQTAPETLAAISEPAALQRELETQVSRAFWNCLQEASRLAPADVDQELCVAMISAMHARKFAAEPPSTK
jgi:hypothetical protein